MNKPAVPSPAINLTSFACPICGAHATQHWYGLHAKKLEKTPNIPPLEIIARMESDAKESDDPKKKGVLKDLAEYFRRIHQGEPFLHSDSTTLHNPPVLENIFVSRCYTCGKLAIWLHDTILYPGLLTGPSPNQDLSEDVRQDYEEARQILDTSPRGAAALLRLAIEKMCIEIGAEGDDINKRIAFLVSQGLPQPVQQALDTVRVIGNEAVHPGQLDLRDDRQTAAKLFDLVNFIAEDRITRPKQIAGLYNMIPEGKRKGIERRDGANQ